ncbi:nucleoside deaminase [Marinobacter alexandrii]|uniref:nucleoside deaminase n=1 Tax=Marinobacter alexandrii TaxID=2570351 RepID=UPI001108AF55|nr:nucleoside deaminase [Marinobacter alexandrii]
MPESSEVVIAAIALGVSILALGFSRYSWWRSKKFSEQSGGASLFLQLRSQYTTFYTRLHDAIPELHYFDEVNLPKSWGLYTAEEKLLAKEYWIISFNEWFATNKFANASDVSLWNEFYGPAIASALRHYVLRRALEEVVNSLYSFGRDEHKFISALYRIIERDIAAHLGHNVDSKNYRYRSYAKYKNFGAGTKTDKEFFDAVIGAYGFIAEPERADPKDSTIDWSILDSGLVHANNLIILLSKLTTRANAPRFHSPSQAIASHASKLLIEMDGRWWPELQERLCAEFYEVFGVSPRNEILPRGKEPIRPAPIHEQTDGVVDLQAAEALLVCIIAADAASKGNYGVGAVAYNIDNFPLAIGGNSMFDPRFDSQAHAEMVVMNKLERRVTYEDLPSCRVTTSLEPCPMCFSRLLNSRVKDVQYLSSDKIGGMVHLHENLPPMFSGMFDDYRNFKQAPDIRLISELPKLLFPADVDPNKSVETFSNLAMLIFISSRGDLDKFLRNEKSEGTGVSKGSPEVD